MNNNNLKIIVLLLPIIVMALLVGAHSHNRDSGLQIRIPVTGYDPRDLLRGHYLTFRYDWNWSKQRQSECSGDECAVCMSDDMLSEEYNPEIYMIDLAAAKKQCYHFIRGYVRYSNNFEIGTTKGYGLRRYYIPEADARKLDRILRGWGDDKHEFDIALRVNDAGEAFIEQMYIDDVALEDWIKIN